jgi:protein-tyrosine phosphatase
MELVRDAAHRDVPDPYYGGPHGFDEVLDLVEAGIDALLDEIESMIAQHEPRRA